MHRRPQVLERVLSEAEAGEQLAQVRSMWELYAVMEFLFLFRWGLPPPSPRPGLTQACMNRVWLECVRGAYPALGT